VLRSQASSLDTLIPPDPTLPLSARRRNATVLLPDGTYRPRESLEQYRRETAGGGPGASFIETAKTKWNSEVLAAVHWAQGKDWGRVREEAEDGVARLLGVELSKEPVTETEVVYHPPPSPPAQAPGPRPRVAGGHYDEPAATHRVSDALHQARDKTVVVAQAMRDEAKEMVEEAREVVGEVMGEAKGAVERGMGRAHDLVERTKAAVHIAEEKAEGRMDARLLHVSDIERALAERYDSARREARLKRSAEEVLRERYIPMDKRDNSELRLV
jgi:altered-inheritance-of-mitochondria protein 5